MEQNKDAAAGDSGPPWDELPDFDAAAIAAARDGRPNEVASEVVDAVQPASAIAEYNSTAAALAELTARLKGRTYDLTTTAGDKLARADRLELTRLISALEAKRVELKAPVLDRGRLLDTEAKRIGGLLEALRDPIDKAIKAAEAEAERKRLAKIEAERVRREGLRDRIAQISAVARRAIGKPSSEIETKIALVVAVPIGDDFAEFKAEAEAAKAESLQQLREMLAAAKAHEDEAARLAEQRAELDRQRAEHEAAALAERQRQETAAATERQREADARVEIEQRQAAARAAQELADREAQAARDAADLKARQEREEADRIAAAHRTAEQARINRERDALQAAQAEARAAAEKRMALVFDAARDAAGHRLALEVFNRYAAGAVHIPLDQVDAYIAELDALRMAGEARQTAERQAAEARAAEEARQAQERAATAAREAHEAAKRTLLEANAKALLDACILGHAVLVRCATAIRTLSSINGARSSVEDDALMTASKMFVVIEAATTVDAEFAEVTPAAAPSPIEAKPKRAPRAKPAIVPPLEGDGGVLEGTNRTTSGAIGKP